MRHCTTISFLALMMFFSVASIAQKTASERLSDLGKTLLDEHITDSVKYMNAEKFRQDFEKEVLDLGPDWVNSTSLPFVSRLTSKDKNTEIFTWALKRSEDSYKSFGFLWNKNPKTGDTRIVRFEDKAETIKNPETKNLGKSTWLGCVYYSLVDISKGKKQMFLVLGYGGHTPSVRRKVAEIISFANTGDVQFGAPVFEKNSRKFNRIVLEFSTKAAVALRFDEKEQILFFDYLVPIDPKYTGNFAYYGPEGSYDAFQLKGQKFTFIKDADARNETEEWGNRSKAVEKKLPPRQN